jgi:hypothetical protein
VILPYALREKDSKEQAEKKAGNARLARKAGKDFYYERRLTHYAQRSTLEIPEKIMRSRPVNEKKRILMLVLHFQEECH